MIIFFFSFLLFSAPENGVRQVTATSCEVIPVKVALGITTQIVLEQEPQVTLFADKTHFKIATNKLATRSLAVIPFVDSSELNLFRGSAGRLPPQDILAKNLDKNFRTNLFVFFKNNNQLMFDLRFTPKQEADYILKVKQDFKKECAL